MNLPATAEAPITDAPAAAPSAALAEPAAGLAPDLRELGEIIQAYSAATAELQQSHELLQRQVMQLTGELQKKNHELSETVSQVSSLKNYLAGIIQSSADGIVAIDLQRRVTALNPAAAAMLAGLRADASGQAEPPPEGRPVLDVLDGAGREFALILMRSLSEGRSFSGVEMRRAGPDGKMRHFSASASPIRATAEDGTVRNVGAVQIFSELTEIRELEERANRQDRLAALGEMAAGVAHEIRNPLGGIELYASNLRRKFAEDSPESATCGKIIAAAASLNRIVTDMLTFTRGRPPQMRPATPGQVLRAAVDMAARELERRGVTAVVDSPQGTTWTMDPDQMVQAALNVILNAAQAMTGGGRVTVSSREVAGAGGGAAALELIFADEGPGIPDSAKEKIFNPFFTLRKDGTGLGMAIVHKIIQDHGGAITIADNQPRGARITFRLPGGS